MQRSQNLVFHNFSLKWKQKIMLRSLPVIKVLVTQVVLILFITNSSSSFQNTKAISTGLSDFHKMVITVLKQTFQRYSPKELVYRDYKNSDRLALKREPEEKLNQQINEYKHFEQTFLEVLNTHAPIKRKFLELTMFPTWQRRWENQLWKRQSLKVNM